MTVNSSQSMEQTSKESASTEANQEISATETPSNTTQPNAAAAKKLQLVAMTVEGGVSNLASVVVETQSEKADQSPLTADEQKALRVCEDVITKGLASFIEVGNALHKIQSQRLYRFSYNSFEEYLASRWKFRRAHAYRLITASRTAADLPPIGDSAQPKNEAQARALTGLTSEQKAAAMQRAQELAGEKPVTAANIKAAAAELKANKPANGAPAANVTEQSEPEDGKTVQGNFTTKPLSFDEILAGLRRGRDRALKSKRLQDAIEVINQLERQLQAHVAALTAAPTQHAGAQVPAATLPIEIPQEQAA